MVFFFFCFVWLEGGESNCQLISTSSQQNLDFPLLGNTGCFHGLPTGGQEERKFKEENLNNQ